MAETNNGNGEDKPKVDPQKQYLIEQFGNLMERVGEGYGGPLQEELIRRMEQTIADFDEEVSEMLEGLRDNSVKRHEKLKEIWENPQQEAPEGDGGSGAPEDASDWEKRVESMADGSDEDTKEEEPKEEEPKKKGLFGRGKK